MEYTDNLSRKYNSPKTQYQAPTKERPSKYKLELLNNPFPIVLTDGKFIYDVFINEYCEIIFKNGTKSSCYYNDVSNKQINTLKLIQ